MRFLCSLCFLFLLACQTDGSTAPKPLAVDGKNFESVSIPGTAAEAVTRRNAAGDVVESGYLENGVKQGSWLTYEADSKLPRRVETFIDGVYNGPVMEIDAQGRVKKMTTYKANVLHGKHVEYGVGRPLKTATYLDGELDGVLSEYDYRSGDLKTEATYAKGVLHGPLRHYDPTGKVTVEYEYRDGERVGGGMVEE